jgi:hypothetical protein
VITSILGSFGILSIIILFVILAKLSQRFGAVIKMPPVYRYYYTALVLLAISYITHVVSVTDIISVETTLAWVLLATYYLPLVFGVTLGLIITWRYWNWLVTEPGNK